MAKKHCVRYKHTASGKRCAKFSTGKAKGRKSKSSKGRCVKWSKGRTRCMRRAK